MDLAILALTLVLLGASADGMYLSLVIKDPKIHLLCNGNYLQLMNKVC